MKVFNIKVVNSYWGHTICKWEAESAEQAVEEFTALNPDYLNKGLIVAEERN